jgi:hypothetical protein
MTVPEGFVLPPLYQSVDPNTVSLALTLGAEAYETLQGMTIKTVRNETHADAIKSIKADMDVEMQALQAVTEEQTRRLRQEKRRVEEALLATQARVEALEQSHSSIRSSSKAEARESFEEVLKAKDEQIAQLHSITGRFDTLQNSLTKSFSSSKEKGAYGEAFTESMLKKAFDCDIQPVSKDANTSDIRMIRGPEQEYFWEVKNYTRMVTADEIEKFRRDMRLHPTIRGGCLVSLRTGITGKARGGDIDIEFLQDGRFILFLSNLLARDDIVFYLQTLRPFFQAVEIYSRPPQEETETVRNLEIKAALIANLLRTHTTTVAKHRNSIVSHKKRTDGMFAEFQAHIMEAESQIQSLFRVALGSDDATEKVIQEAETTLPVSIFKKERLSEYDGRTKSFVEWLLGATMEGGQLEIKDLIEQAKSVGFGEKFIRDLRDEVFQQMAWVKGSRYIIGIQWKVLIVKSSPGPFESL